MLFAFDGDAGNENLPHNYTNTQIAVYAGTHDNDALTEERRNWIRTLTSLYKR